MKEKTKAVALNRQCRYRYRRKKQFDITRAVAGGQITSCSNALLRLPQSWGDLTQNVGCTAMQHTRQPDYWYQLLVSPERCCSSLRMMRFIHAASESSPSCCWAFSICSRSSGSNLNWKGGLPLLSLLCVDTSITPVVMCLCVMTHYIQETQIATPRSAGTLPRRLTKNVNRSNAMAKPQCNQTHPKFTWRFLAVPTITPDIKPIVLYTNASTEQDARNNCPGWMLFFAARLPLQEVIHG